MLSHNPSQAMPLLFRIWNKRTNQYIDEETTLYLGITSHGKIAAGNSCSIFDVTAPEDYGWEVEMWTGTYDENTKPLYVGDRVSVAGTLATIVSDPRGYGIKLDNNERFYTIPSNMEIYLVTNIHKEADHAER